MPASLQKIQTIDMSERKEKKRRTNKLKGRRSFAFNWHGDGGF